MKFSKINKDKSTKIFPPLLLLNQQKVQILKKTTGLCSSRSYYSMGSIATGIHKTNTVAVLLGEVSLSLSLNP